jgi:hypothetical protein
MFRRKYVIGEFNIVFYRSKYIVDVCSSARDYWNNFTRN